jgi:hypothetical protein
MIDGGTYFEMSIDSDLCNVAVHRNLLIYFSTIYLRKNRRLFVRYEERSRLIISLNKFRESYSV